MCVLIYVSVCYWVCSNLPHLFHFPIGEQNGEHIIGHRKDPEDKRHLVENQELPPKYSATNGVNGSSRTPQDGGADDEEPEKKAPKVGTMALVRILMN